MCYGDVANNSKVHAKFWFSACHTKNLVKLLAMDLNHDFSKSFVSMRSLYGCVFRESVNL